MHPDITKLLEVQKVDSEIARIQRDIDSLPAEEARRSGKLAQVRGECELKKTQLAEAQVRGRENEVSLKAADQEIAKLEGRLNGVKNNAEYQATLLQIEAVRRERGELEEEGLGYLEGLDGQREELTQLEAQLASAEEEFQGFMAEATALKEKLDAELAEVSQGRDGMVTDVPKELQEKYRTVFDVRDGLAVCSVEASVCTGCYTSVTPNDMARLLGAQSIVQCSSCQRLLYLAVS